MSKYALQASLSICMIIKKHKLREQSQNSDFHLMYHCFRGHSGDLHSALLKKLIAVPCKGKKGGCAVFN